MRLKAILQIRSQASINHGSRTITDAPLGTYDSEQGKITVVERVDDPDYGIYFNIDLHDPPPDFDQEAYEFLNVYVWPPGVVLKSPEQELSANYMSADKAFVEEACVRWRLSNDAALKTIADMLEHWLKHGGIST